jgi:hypothetical protein
MLARKRLLGAAAASALAMLFVLPAMARATPQFRINGVLAGPATHDVVAVGSLTMDNKMFGEWKCKVIAGLTVDNESEKGVAAIDGWESFDCSANQCPGPVSFVAETPPKLGETINAKKEVIYGPPEKARGARTLPWPAEIITGEASATDLNIRKIRLVLTCPAETFEPNFAGNIEPHIVNGIGNGLSPSHLVFEGKGGHTSWLNGTWLGGTETEETKLYLSGELTLLGTGQELITAG